MSHLKSPIWAYFSIYETDNSKAVCKIFSEKILRGGSASKTFNTTTLRNHLRRHPDENKKLIVAETAKKESQQAHSSTLSTHQTTVWCVWCVTCVQHKPPMQ